MKKAIVGIFSILSLSLVIPVWAKDAASVQSQAATNDVQATVNVKKVTHADHLVKADVKLAQEKEKLFARMTLSMSNNKPGKVLISWIAPQKSGCNNSHYSLKYQNTQYHTRAYRTVVHVDAKGQQKVCAGTWRVFVYDMNKKRLASSSYKVGLNQSNPENVQQSTVVEKTVSNHPHHSAHIAVSSEVHQPMIVDNSGSMNRAAL